MRPTRTRVVSCSESVGDTRCHGCVDEAFLVHRQEAIHVLCLNSIAFMKAVIVGAGAAGLTAGYLLDRSGVEFEILEARSEYGGRVRKLEGFADFPIDLGAEWIHRWIAARPPIFTELLQGEDPRLPTFQEHLETVSQWTGEKLRTRNWWRYIPKPTDLKFVDGTWFDALNRLVTPGVAERLHLNTPVTSIDYRANSVSVETLSGEKFQADRVLVTTPISMLQRGGIRFNPDLPKSKKDEIMKERMPGGLKVFLRFSQRFYPDLIYVGGFLKGGVLNECGYYNAALGKNSECNVLALFTQGAKAERYIEQLTEEDLLHYVLLELDSMFEGRASSLYEDHVIQNWAREPYIHGSYSQRKASAKKLAEPVAGKLFFAGEAMNIDGKTIAVHGACASAYAAVEAMCSSAA